MKTASVSELEHGWSRIVGWLEAGETVELKKHSRTFATIMPAKPEVPRTQKPVNRQEWLEELRARKEQVLGGTMLTAAESAFIRDRGDW